MLHVIFTPPFDDLLKNTSYLTTQFEIGQSTNAINPDLVQCVIADGTELVEIVKYFEGIPKRFLNHYATEEVKSDATMKWFGDDAKFIVANWT